MSYEGATELWCVDGHYTVIDCYHELGQCRCGKRFVWTRDVDETNCDGVYTVNVVAIPARYETCSLGYQHCTREVRYALPLEGHAI